MPRYHLTRQVLESAYRELHSWTAVAKRLGITRSGLIAARHRLGMPVDGTKPPPHLRRKRPGRLDGTADEIRRCAALGWSCQMIADRLGQTTSEQVRRRMVREGIPRILLGPMKGKYNHAWRGGRSNDKEYVLVRAPDGHPHPKSSGYIYEHRHVMEQKLGRYLEPAEVVHHIDANKQNNHLDNLELFESQSAHLRHEWAQSGWAQHQSESRKKDAVAGHTPLE